MIFKTKDEILNWLEKYDRNYQENMEKNAYEFIDIHDSTNQILFKEMMNKEHLTHHYCENLKSEDHQYIINVKNSVDISRKKLEIIPIQFYDVDGYFSCIHNQLTSLRGCPQYVGDSFFCQYNQLTSLKYSPQSIGGMFYCNNNKIKLLKYF